MPLACPLSPEPPDPAAFPPGGLTGLPHWLRPLSIHSPCGGQGHLSKCQPGHVTASQTLSACPLLGDKAGATGSVPECPSNRPGLPLPFPGPHGLRSTTELSALAAPSAWNTLPLLFPEVTSAPPSDRSFRLVSSDSLQDLPRTCPFPALGQGAHVLCAKAWGSGLTFPPLGGERGELKDPFCSYSSVLSPALSPTPGT